MQFGKRGQGTVERFGLLEEVLQLKRTILMIQVHIKLQNLSTRFRHTSQIHILLHNALSLQTIAGPRLLMQRKDCGQISIKEQIKSNIVPRQHVQDVDNLNLMEGSLNESLNSMMRSVSQNFGDFDLNPQPLHTGRHGQVFVMRSRKDGRQYALKVVWRRSGTSYDALKAYKQEVAIHQALKRRHIVTLERSFQDDDNLYLVLEYCQQGSLRQKIANSRISGQAARDYALQISRGLSYLHKQGVIHGDLRPEHVLINEAGELKLCDFGAAVKTETKARGTYMGGPVYAAPETAEGTIDQAVDVWALGCLMYEISTRRLPFSVATWQEHRSTLTKSSIQNLKLPSSLSPSLTSLLKDIFQHNKADRPTIDQLMKHSYFTQSEATSICTSVSSSRSKIQSSHRSVQTIRSDKENRNQLNLPLKNTAPNYKQLISQRRGLKDRNKKTAEDRPVRCLSPLNTLGLKLKQIELGNRAIAVNKEGITIRGKSDSMTISPDGSSITLSKEEKTRKYTLKGLPTQHHRRYEEAKKTLKEIQRNTARVSYSDERVSIKIMYDGSIKGWLEGELIMEQVTEGDLLNGKVRIQQEALSEFKGIYSCLMALQSR